MANGGTKPSLPEGLLIKTEADRFQVVSGGALIDLGGSTTTPPPLPATPPTVAPPKPIADKPTAAHFFYAEDEEEIRRHAEKISGLERQSLFDLEAIVRKLTSQFGLSFPDPVLLSRFRRTIEARLKELRDDLETVDLLARPTKIGGLALPPELAEQVVEALAPDVDQIHRLKPPGPLKPLEKRPEVSVPRPPPPPPPLPRPAVTVPPRPQPAPRPTWAEAAVAPKPVLSPSFQPTVPPPPRATVPPPPPPPPRSVAPTILKIERPVVVPDRPVVQDIRRPTKLIGPVEELKTMTLEEFRRLGPTPTAAAKKMKEKIATLAEESFSQAVEGISAWRTSETHRLYLDLGRASMEAGRPIREIITDRQSRGEPTLTNDEFHAVLQLNKELRF